MASVSRLILKHLDELVKEDFERFKWSLVSDMVEGFSSIPRSKLEKAERYNVVQLMVDQYEPTDAAKITVQVLKQIGQQKLSSDLEKQLTGRVQAAEVDSAPSSSSSSSSPAAGVSQSVSAKENCVVQAPVLSGGHFHGPVTMNFNPTPK